MPEPDSAECSDCSECSHCAKNKRSQIRLKAGVRVSVNLRHFFSDQRARAFMWAPYGRCVQWLGRRVARVFGLPDDIALMSRGHMLPVIEPLLMLDRDDPVDVVKMSYVFTAHDKKEDIIETNQRNSNEAHGSNAGDGTVASSTLNIKQEPVCQFPTSSQSENRPEERDLASFTVGQDIQATLDGCDGQSADDREKLQLLKRRALRLLEEHCMLNEVPAKRLRRRRRRRKPLPGASRDIPDDVSDAGDAVDAGDAGGTMDAGVIMNENVVEGGGAASDGRASSGLSAAVLRNGAGSLPPRLVRALSPVAQAQAVL